MVVTSTISPSVKIGLRLLGVWPGVHPTVFWLIYLPYILIVQYFQYLYVFSHFNLSELSNLVDSLPPTLNYTLTILKLVSVWIHRRIIHKIVTAMDNNWRECIDVDHQFYIMTIKANISHFCSNAMLSFCVFSALLYLLGNYGILLFVGDDNDTIRELPVKIQFPFEADKSPIFELLVTTLSLQLIVNGLIIAVLNGFIFSLILHVSGQIDIICEEFRIISKQIQLHESSTFKLGMLIKRHNKIISFTENIENFVSSIALMQVVSNTSVISCLGFIAIISLSNDDGAFMLLKVITPYVALLMEIFLFCFAGEYLSHKSKTIANAAYDSLWYNMPLNRSKSIAFIIMRSQTRLTITAGKIISLSLESFASILKTSVSYISVVYAMY